MNIRLFVRVKQHAVLNEAERLYGEVRSSLRATERDTLSLSALAERLPTLAVKTSAQSALLGKIEQSVHNESNSGA